MRLRFLALLFVAWMLMAADISGKWSGRIEGGDRETVFTFKSEGNTITGTMSNPDIKDRPLKGTVDGDKINFTVDSEWQGNPVKLQGTGTVSGDEMKLTLSAEGGGWSAQITAKRS